MLTLLKNARLNKFWLANVQGIRDTTQNMVTQLAESADMSRRLKNLIDSLEEASNRVTVR